MDHADMQGFYTNRMGNKTEKVHQEFHTDKAASTSAAIAGVEPISPELVSLWVSQWKKSGFLS
jgi:hypothetical protein